MRDAVEPAVSRQRAGKRIKLGVVTERSGKKRRSGRHRRVWSLLLPGEAEDRW